MSKVNELIEHWDESSVDFDHDLLPPGSAFTIAQISSSKIFSVQDGIDLNAFYTMMQPSADVLIKLPYEKCLFEFNSADKKTGESFVTWVHCTAFASGSIVMRGLGYVGHKITALLYSSFISHPYTEDDIRLHINNRFTAENYKLIEENAYVDLQIVTTLLKLMESDHVYFDQKRPSSLKQKLRKTKTRLFEYKELVLSVPNKDEKIIYEPGDDKEKRTSPRLHEVRGHWRHYKSGKKTWVNSTTRGDREKGLIIKDYSVR